MLGVVDKVCTEGLTVTPGAPPPTVALVVGSAHLPGEGVVVGPVSFLDSVNHTPTEHTGSDARGTTTHSSSGSGVSAPAR
jgi:hypothetical protein